MCEYTYIKHICTQMLVTHTVYAYMRNTRRILDQKY